MGEGAVGVERSHPSARPVVRNGQARSCRIKSRRSPRPAELAVVRSPRANSRFDPAGTPNIASVELAMVFAAALLLAAGSRLAVAIYRRRVGHGPDPTSAADNFRSNLPPEESNSRQKSDENDQRPRGENVEAEERRQVEVRITWRSEQGLWATETLQTG